MSLSHWIYKAHIFLVLALCSARLASSLITPRDFHGPIVQGRAMSSVEKRSDITAPSSDLVDAFQSSFWIWSQDPNNPPVAPVGDVAFRKTLTVALPSKILPTSVDILMAVDNLFQLYVDGLFVGQSPQSAQIWKKAQYYTVPLASDLPTHVFAVLGTNSPDGDPTWNPAGLLAAIEIHFSDGSSKIITADSSWIYTENNIPSNWFAPSIDTSKWLPAKEVDPYGSGPWADLVTIPEAYTASGLTFDKSYWIWSSQPNPPNAPPGSNAFRKTFTAPPGKSLQSASILITVDDLFVLYVDGTLIGASPNQTNIWESPQQFTAPLSGTTTVFAVNGTNLPDVHTGGDGPAGTLVMINVQFTDGTTQAIVSDTTWKVFQSLPTGFQNPDFNDANWPNAVSQGVYGSQPWGRVLPK